MSSNVVVSRNQKYWLLILYLVVLEMIFYFTIVPEKTIREILTEHKELLEYSCCVAKPAGIPDTVRTDVIFLKTNKSGSSIVFKMLLRFSLNYNLDVFFPKVEDMKTSNDKYQMLFQFDYFDPNVYEYAYKDAYTITILRDPVAVFQALYDEYRKKNTYGTFKDFTSKLANNWNPISTQLGLKKEFHHNESEILNFIHEVERKFDYIMIYEHLDISLIILSNLMGWPLEYVTNIFIDKNPAPKFKLTEISKIRLMELNLADSMLYEYFLEKLENCAMQYGVSQLIDEMNTLSLIADRMKHHCASYNQSDAYAPRTYWSCDDFFKTEEQFMQQIKEQQILRMKQEKATDYLIIW